MRRSLARSTFKEKDGAWNYTGGDFLYKPFEIQGKPIEYASLLEAIFDEEKDNAEDRNTWTPLHHAVKHDRLDVASLLISKGVNVNARTDFNETPLHWAARNGALGMAELLLSKGAGIDAENNGEKTPLYYAEVQGSKKLIRFLRSKGARSDLVMRRIKAFFGMTAEDKRSRENR